MRMESTDASSASPSPKPQNAVKTQMAAYELGAPMTSPKMAVMRHVKLNALMRCMQTVSALRIEISGSADNLSLPFSTDDIDKHAPGESTDTQSGGKSGKDITLSLD